MSGGVEARPAGRPGDARRGSLPAFVANLAPDGSPVPGTDGSFRVRWRDLLARDITLLRGFGDYRLVLTPSPDGEAQVSVGLAIEFAKPRGAPRDALAGARARR